MPSQDSHEETPEDQSWHIYSEGGEEDFTPWIVDFVRSMYAEHNSQLFDHTPVGAIETIVSLTIYALHNYTNK